MITCIIVPITNYMGDGIFEQHLYFEGKQAPSKEEVLRTLKKLHEEYSFMNGYTGEQGECIEITKLVEDKDWRRPTERMYTTNTFIEHPKFGTQPYVWKVIIPNKDYEM